MRENPAPGDAAPVELIPVRDADDPRIEPFRLVRERDLAGRGGLIAEGAVVLDQLLASPHFEPRALLLLPARVAGLRARLERLAPHVPVFVAEPAVFDRIAGFPVHRGILAHAVRREGVGEERAGVLSRAAAERGVVVVACGIANHDNMGAIFRNAAAFGVSAVLLDERSCDPLYRKAIRVSVGTVLGMPFWRGGTPEAIWAELGALGFEALALSPAGERPVGEVEAGPAHALFLGTEGEGLGEPFLTPRRSLRIPMAPGLDSLNVATCAAIALHRLFELRRT